MEKGQVILTKGKREQISNGQITEVQISNCLHVTKTLNDENSNGVAEQTRNENEQVNDSQGNEPSELKSLLGTMCLLDKLFNRVGLVGNGK